MDFPVETNGRALVEAAQMIPSVHPLSSLSHTGRLAPRAASPGSLRQGRRIGGQNRHQDDLGVVIALVSGDDQCDDEGDQEVEAHELNGWRRQATSHLPREEPHPRQDEERHVVAIGERNSYDLVRGNGGPLTLIAPNLSNSQLSINESGTVAFVASPDIFVSDGITTKLVVSHPQAGPASINEAGKVLYPVGGQIYLWDPVTETASLVLDFFDDLDGSTIYTNAVTGPKTLNDHDQFVFYAQLADGRAAIFRADPPAPPPPPAVPALSGPYAILAALLIWLSGLRMMRVIARIQGCSGLPAVSVAPGPSSAPASR